MSKRADILTPDDNPHNACMHASEVTTRICRECRKFHTHECSDDQIIKQNNTITHLIQPNDPICDEFQERLGRLRGDSRGKRQKKEWKLDLYAPIPTTLKPCGFYGDTLTESTWLPYKSNGEIQLRPSLIIAKKDGYKIVDFLKGEHDVKGTFPSKELQTLMQPQTVQMLESKAKIEPNTIDEAINKAFQTHLEMPKAETTLAKRWIEGTYFYDVFDAYPIESILGVSESGKSRLCLLNLALSYHAEGLIDPTEASIFRAKEEDRVTLVCDETEYLNNPHLYATLRILINASYSKASGYVTHACMHVFLMSYQVTQVYQLPKTGKTL